MNFLVISRSRSSTRKGQTFEGKAGWKLRQRQLQETGCCAPPLPLQLLAATATLGRPLHRRLAAFIRWKEQRMPRTLEPPLHAGIIGLNGMDAASLRERRQALGSFATPQQRMRRAFERLTSRGLLGLPRLPPATGEDRMPTSSSEFKAILPVIR